MGLEALARTRVKAHGSDFLARCRVVGNPHLDRRVDAMVDACLPRSRSRAVASVELSVVSAGAYAVAATACTGLD